MADETKSGATLDSSIENVDEGAPAPTGPEPGVHDHLPAGDLHEFDNVDHNDASLSAAPPRDHANLVPQLDLRWGELKEFCRTLEGNVEGELGDLLNFVRGKL